MKNKLAWIYSFDDITATITKPRVHVVNLIWNEG